MDFLPGIVAGSSITAGAWAG